MNKIKETTVNDLQTFCARGAILHPVIHYEFLKKLYIMSKQQRCSMLPEVLLEYYNLKVNKQISQKTVIQKLKKVA